MLGFARVCLDLVLSREMTTEAIQETGPTELILSATANLGLSPSVVTFLLAQLIVSDSTAARLADSYLLLPPYAAAGSMQQVSVKEGGSNGSPVFLGHGAGEEVINKAGQGMNAAGAVMALSEACLTWRDTIEAVHGMTKRASLRDSNGPEKVVAVTGVVLGGPTGVEEEHIMCSTPLGSSSELPRDRHHSLAGRSSTASAADTRMADVPQEPDKNERPRCQRTRGSLA